MFIKTSLKTQKMLEVFLILFQCHRESAQYNIVLLLLNIIFKHNLKNC